jgi:hypothetical protein
MQKIEGSSPFIRFNESPRSGGVSRLRGPGPDRGGVTIDRPATPSRITDAGADRVLDLIADVRRWPRAGGQAKVASAATGRADSEGGWPLYLRRFADVIAA